MAEGTMRGRLGTTHEYLRVALFVNNTLTEHGVTKAINSSGVVQVRLLSVCFAYRLDVIEVGETNIAV